MSQSHRLAEGGEIDREKPLSFTFDGERLMGYAGDTLASALLANGIRTVGRSFKYHRPRGVMAAGVEEPNAILDLRHEGRQDPNARATRVLLEEGMALGPVNAAPSLRADRYRGFDRLARFLPAGFYYKTFMRPAWMQYEPAIRKAAGLGRLAPEQAPKDLAYEQRNARCDILVVGAGPTGLAAARAAAESGLSVWLVDLENRAGGQLLWRDERVAGEAAAAWAAKECARLAALPNVTVKLRTEVAAYYDMNRLTLLEQRARAPKGFARERLWILQARQVILATGAHERPMVFPDNDRPGVMLAGAAATYLRRYAVLPGRQIVLSTNNDDGYASALLLKQAGASVLIADSRMRPPPELLSAMDLADIPVMQGSLPLAVEGKEAVQGVHLGPVRAASAKDAKLMQPADLLLMAGGWQPAVHLFSQSGGKLSYDAQLTAFRPKLGKQACRTAGAAGGMTGLDDCLASGHQTGVDIADALGKTVALERPKAEGAAAPYRIEPLWRSRVAGARQWVDHQNDVTEKDVVLAAQEGYRSVEHLKRYTTLGMATDQGKTSNVIGLAILGEETGRAPGEVGTTTFRPPYTPLSLGAIAGLYRGDLLQTRRQLPAAERHKALGGLMRDYGLWVRPACYLQAGEDEAAATQREALAVRRTVGLMDGSSLGKIAVVGPDAATFVNRFYYNRLDNLAPGRLRYCFQLNETGTVSDDGVVARLAEDRYLLSPSSGHTDHVLHAIEEWHQGEWPDLEVFFHDETQAWATYAVTGPRAPQVLAKLETAIDWRSLSHMSLAEGEIAGVRGRIQRVSFTGEASFELSVPADYGAALWDRLLALGEPEGITPFGIESLMILRTEKGYIIVGRDTDGMTMPQDLGMSGPLRNKDIDYVGRRSLTLPVAQRPGRLQLVGLAVPPGEAPLPNGAHAIHEDEDSGEVTSLGYVTSSFWSPTLKRAIALGLIADGHRLLEEGASLTIAHLGKRRGARAVQACFYDPEGERLK